jgi:hypothetical protein
VLKYAQDNFEMIFNRARQDILKEDYRIFNEIPDEYRKTDVRSLISIHSVEDVLNKRKELIQFIFGEPDLPLSLFPQDIERKIVEERFSDSVNLKAIDRITIEMDNGINSIAYLFRPARSNNRLIIYCEGHEGDFVFGKNTINFFLGKGYFVLALNMPLVGMNSRPVVILDRIGRFKLEAHDHLKFISRPIKYFLEPIIVALNYLTKEYAFRDISIIGISGGGWTATLVAAIDTRISKSFPVAGTYPIFLRSDCPRDYGDFEQTLPELYRIVDYLDLYIMGSYGKGREQVQIINQYDPCCFAGIKYRMYEAIVSEAVQKLGEGKFWVLLDDTHRTHKISLFTLNTVLKELEAQ